MTARVKKTGAETRQQRKYDDLHAITDARLNQEEVQ
jgi:hypothetical protein